MGILPLTKMIEGCLDWQENGLQRPACVQEATENYFADQDLISQWIIEAHDPEREGLRTVLQAWYEHWGESFVTTKDLLAREALDGGSIPDSQIALYQALLEAIPHGRELTGRLLGKWLARHNGRMIDRLRLHQGKDRHAKTALWQVLETQTK